MLALTLSGLHHEMHNQDRLCIEQCTKSFFFLMIQNDFFYLLCFAFFLVGLAICGVHICLLDSG
jgi:hypothetical protein